jgi:hypothetical protein
VDCAYSGDENYATFQGFFGSSLRCDDGSSVIVSRRCFLHMLPELHSILNLLEGGFGQLKVLVIGDIMLDRYIHGEVDRISPEAPVPVLRHAQRMSGQVERPTL